MSGNKLLLDTNAVLYVLNGDIIAATSITLNLPLVTSDKHFKNVAILNLVYYEK